MSGEFLKTIAIEADKMEWITDIDPITGDKFYVKELFTDPHTDMTVVYCVCPKGYVKPEHHHTYGQGIYVLDGAMEADGKIYHKGDFVWFPAGVVGTHGATTEGDLTFLAVNTGSGHAIYDKAGN